DHRNLHSFPTRRSSDLCLKENFLRKKPPPFKKPNKPEKERIFKHKKMKSQIWMNVLHKAELREIPNVSKKLWKPLFATDQKLVEDRKSTRLNSSHVKIS